MKRLTRPGAVALLRINPRLRPHNKVNRYTETGVLPIVTGRTLLNTVLIIAVAVLILWAASKLWMPKRVTPYSEGKLLETRSIRGAGPKKVIVLLADSLLYQSLDKGMEKGELPTFKHLIREGMYHKDVVSSFPTMSVTIDSSLITGTYPDDHRIPGLIWYSAKENRVINYGTGPIEELKQGVNPLLTDLLINLNQKHLSPDVETIYETIAKRGLTSGSVNALMYRGPAKHTLQIPAWLSAPTDLPKRIEVKSPPFFAYGSFANPLEGRADLPEGITEKLGFNNEYPLQTAKYLIENDRLPDLLLLYLPDLDKRLHHKGPEDLEYVKRLDSQLKTFLQSFGSIENALDQIVLIILGDSGVSHLKAAEHRPVIELNELIERGGLKVHRTGDAIGEQKPQIVLAVNETMAYVYSLDPDVSIGGRVARLLRDESRIDLLAWKENDWNAVTRSGFKGTFRFKPKGAVKDIYGQTWTAEGDWSIVGATADDDGRIAYDEYPDALRRLDAALHSHAGEFLIATAKEGYEFADRYSPTHKNGGGHGSLSRTDSLIPVIICGTDKDLDAPHRRIVDMKDYLLRLLAE